MGLRLTTEVSNTLVIKQEQQIINVNNVEKKINHFFMNFETPVLDKELVGRYIFVIGSYKSGKSWLCKQLMQSVSSNIDDPVKNTLGLRIYGIKDPEQSGKYYLVDTEGINQPMDSSKSEIIKTYLVEQVANSASMIIYVVDKFFGFEWELFNEIMEMSLSSNVKPRILLLHNNMVLEDRQDLVAYKDNIQKHITGIFKSGPQIVSKYDTGYATHIFTIRTGSNDSVSVNRETINYILSEIKNLVGMEVNLVEEIKSTLQSFSETNDWKCEYSPIDGFSIPPKLLQPFASSVKSRHSYSQIPVNEDIKFEVNLPFCEYKSIHLSMPSSRKVEIKYIERITNPSNQITTNEVNKIIYSKKPLSRRTRALEFMRSSLQVDETRSCVTFTAETTG